MAWLKKRCNTMYSSQVELRSSTGEFNTHMLVTKLGTTITAQQQYVNLIVVIYAD